MTSSLTTRSLDSFAIFDDKKFVGGYQNLVTIQPLNKSKRRGWFIRNSDLDTCGWSAKPSDFDKNSIIFDYEHAFGMPPNTSKELGLNLQAPRVQVLLRSPLMVEETTGMRQIIGTFEDPQVKDLWDADKTAADLENSKNAFYKRKYAVRTKYLVYILTKENTRAHKLPMVLTLKGLNGTDVSEKIKMFEKEMSKCLSKAMNKDVPVNYNEKFQCTTVFCPTLVGDMRGYNNVEICAIESFEVPEYQTQEAALESLSKLSIPNEDRESTWKFQEMYEDYINQHSKQDANRLKGAYGMKEGLNILPESRADATEVTVMKSSRDDLGADSAF